MKTVKLKLLVMAIASFCFFTQLNAQNMKKEIEATISNYAKGGDNHDTGLLQTVLHDDYRLVWNDKTKPDLFIADKATFIGNIEQKVWGGDKRKVDIKITEVFDGNNALARVTMTGAKADFESVYTLVRQGDEWKILHELVTAKFKQ
ncbi:nuclear transport factor 2 family protein [Flexithrix dorotheae]|uniref:nuclear transport factor 2 family protein n=1 Tax=Flexithrix dorotheae TaxID=70993 RepID=UPI00037A8A74|nr:nuclear transport factor 2 family protein [Flexithrix dorotheae]